MTKVAIIGAGSAGLLCGQYLSEHGADVVVLKHTERPLGWDLLQRGDVVLYDQDLVDWLDVCGLPSSEYRVHAGIHLRGGVDLYPFHFRGRGRQYPERVRTDLWRKTRIFRPEFGKGSDPEADSKRTAIRFDPLEFVRAAELELPVIRRPVRELVDGAAILTNGRSVAFDYAVVTLPVWELAKIAPWPLPEIAACCVQSVHVTPYRDPYASWDLVLTPYTPEDCIHRLVSYEGGYLAHASGGWSIEVEAGFRGDLNFLFPDGWLISGGPYDVPGHVFECDERIQHPDNVIPLGRFAEWDQAVTLDESFAKVRRLAKLWGLDESEST